MCKASYRSYLDTPACSCTRGHMTMHGPTVQLPRMIPAVRLVPGRPLRARARSIMHAAALAARMVAAGKHAILLWLTLCAAITCHA